MDQSGKEADVGASGPREPGRLGRGQAERRARAPGGPGDGRAHQEVVGRLGGHGRRAPRDRACHR